MKSISAAAVCALSLSVTAFGPAIAGGSASGATAGSARNTTGDLKLIDTVVVIYAENRSFDNLYGSFPGANGVSKAPASARIQRDRDGRPFRELPPIWEGLTAKGVTPPVTQAETEHLPNRPFRADDPKGFNLTSNTITRDLWHRYYQNQMQIDGGRNDKFVAYADSGALAMSFWDGSKTAMWKVAQKYALADNFFMGAFGGSFFNHQWLICACAPYYPNADTSAAKPSIAVVEPDGVTLKAAANSPKSAMDGIPKFAGDGNLTPDFYAVNTMQPPYQPSGNGPAPDGDKALADPNKPTTLPPQIEPTIGDMLSLKHVTWAWYSGAWQDVLDHGNKEPVPNLQYHHQPFNYYANFAPGTAARAEHLRDGGLGGTEFIKAIDAGTLPQVSFYKPQGNLNEHSGYADIEAGDAHIADLIAHLEKSPQWPHMLVVVTYDENGGIWDHVAPPKGDRWGPGSRIPAIIVSPFARHGFVDHTPMDTTSILRFITRRFELPTLHGITVRDAAIAARKQKPLGDLTSALMLTQK
ncbi:MULTISPECIES: acid phosphatase [Rhizobium]|uniref:Phospholipase C n=1 Tax=Rhizobium paranaense TaxID=1650438 RepID=A0A7W8XXA6_9HYPH|nr:acid phosphatase [Rhizobium paranaense]MBB5577302.1 phospholipase C [Rhizobium paranaense]